MAEAWLLELYGSDRTAILEVSIRVLRGSKLTV